MNLYVSANMLKLLMQIDTIVQTCPQILRQDLIWFYKHVQTWTNIMTQFDTILQTCPDLFKYYNTIWYDSTNMSKPLQILWHDLIWFYKHVQTCPWFYDTIWYNSANMSRHVQILWHDLIWFYKTQIENMTKYTKIE